MTDPIDPLRPIIDERRRRARRRADPPPPPLVEGERSNLPAAAANRAEPEPAPEDGPAVFAAQLLGQNGQKRGLRGGPPVLAQARSAYLETEWSGRNDRRPPRGVVAKTEI